VIVTPIQCRVHTRVNAGDSVAIRSLREQTRTHCYIGDHRADIGH
jgi:hypothetical protein